MQKLWQGDRGAVSEDLRPLEALHHSALPHFAHPGLVEQRLAALRDLADHGTQKFIVTWGEAHRARIISWFEQAERELQ